MDDIKSLLLRLKSGLTGIGPCERRHASIALVLFAVAVFVPRARYLIALSSRKAKLLTLAQLVLLTGGTLLRRFIPEGLEYLVEWFRLRLGYGIPLATLGCLVADALTRRNRLVRRIFWTVMFGGMIPCIEAAVSDGFDGLLEGNTDIIALLSMQLGIFLGHIRASAVILLMITGGEAFEKFALGYTGRKLHSLLQQSPGTAHRLVRDGTFLRSEDIPAVNILHGDTVLVKKNESVPVDGTINNSILQDSDHLKNTNTRKLTALVDESLLTGEQMASAKQEGDAVYAGSRNRGDAFYIRALKRYDESTFALMKTKLKQALNSKARVELKSKQFAALFAPITLFLAAIALILSKSKPSHRRSWETVLAVLMSATPCPATVGVPIAFLGGISAACKYGGTIKSGSAIEALAVTDVVVLDKTGTITLSTARVTDVIFWPTRISHPQKIDNVEILQMVASLQQFSTHPLGDAIREFFFEKYGIYSMKPIHDFSSEEGCGVQGYSGTYKIKTGTSIFCFGVVDDDEKGLNQQRFHPSKYGKSDRLCSYFALSNSNGTIAAGVFYFDNPIRDSARSLVKKLRMSNIRVQILSGDHTNHLRKVAESVGIDEYKSCWPHEKAHHIEFLREQGNTVVMIGDGGNDAAALAAANVGISLGADSVAEESASVALLNNNLENVVELMALSKRIVQVAKSTVFYGMGLSFAQMVLASTGHISPLSSAIGQEIIDLSSILYALVHVTKELRVSLA